MLNWPAEKRQALVAAGRATVLEKYNPAQERERAAAILAGLKSAPRASGENHSSPTAVRTGGV